MASIRKKLAANANDSKNTRMNIAEASFYAGWKPDELAHISRYCKIAQLILEERQRLGRLVDVFEVGCGQLWPLRVIYKAHMVRKDDVVRQYIGYDIDPGCLRDFWQDLLVEETAFLRHFDGRVVIQDMTVDPTLMPSNASDGLFDVFITTEVIEHMYAEFVEPWIANAAARLRPGGLAYVSTPNHDGSNSKLPEDHVYEWRYHELERLLGRYFEIVNVSGIFTQMPKFRAARRADPFAYAHCPDEVVDLITARFDVHWQRVVFAMFYPRAANNCAWTLRKRG